MEKDLSGKQAVYNPHIFEVNNFEEAKKIILTPEKGITSAERWEKETPFIVKQIREHFNPSEDSVIVDYGCGIGRLAKGLLQKLSCCILGIDISLTMRQLAPAYVKSPLFSVCTPQVLDFMVLKGFRVDFIYSVWVLQHCLNPVDDLLRFRNVLDEGGLLYILNNNNRAVPTDKGWVNDGIDLEKLLGQNFKEVWSSPIPEWLVNPEAPELTFQKLYRKD